MALSCVENYNGDTIIRFSNYDGAHSSHVHKDENNMITNNEAVKVCKENKYCGFMRRNDGEPGSVVYYLNEGKGSHIMKEFYEGKHNWPNHHTFLLVNHC
jgi:hypothetical protein